MTIAYWCVFLAAIHPYICTALAKVSGGYDASANRDPRSWQKNLQGVSLRLHNAHLNCFEAFPPFAAAVIIAALVGNASQSTVDYLAVGFIAFRLIYTIACWRDISILRTVFWSFGFLATLGIFIVSA